MSGISDRLKEFIAYKRMKITHFENDCGFSNGYVNALRKGIGEDRVKIIKEKYPELNTNWLLYGIGEMLVADENAKSQPVQTADWRIKMYEDLHEEDVRKIRELQLALYEANHRIEELESRLSKKIVG